MPLVGREPVAGERDRAAKSVPGRSHAVMYGLLARKRFTAPGVLETPRPPDAARAQIDAPSMLPVRVSSTML
jgi:hypothetical protein